MKKTVFLAAVLAAGVTFFAQAMGSQEPKKDAQQDSMMKSDSTMMKSNDSMMKTDNAMKSDNSMMKSDNAMKSDNSMMKSNSMMVSDDARKMSADPMDITAYNVQGLGKQVVPFTTEAAAQMLAKNQTVVYFFAATWCPYCQATYKDIKANFAKIPSNVTLVFVNYDKASDLKTKYGVTMQDTFVVIGADGMKKTAWSGIPAGSSTVSSDTVSQIVAKATQAM